MRINKLSTASSIQFIGAKIIGLVTFDVPGESSFTMGDVSSTKTVNIPANASYIFLKTSINPAGTAFPSISTVQNTSVTAIESWGVYTQTFLISLSGCTNLINVPVTSPPWSNWSSLFSECSSLNQDLSTWNTSHVTATALMFLNCRQFNKNISSWDVSNIYNMNQMFNGCTEFNQSLNTWNTSKLKHISGTFKNCPNFNQSISNWNVSIMENMSEAFMNASSFNQNLSNLKFPKVPSSNRINYDSAATSWLPQNKPTFALT